MPNAAGKLFAEFAIIALSSLFFVSAGYSTTFSSAISVAIVAVIAALFSPTQRSNRFNGSTYPDNFVDDLAIITNMSFSKLPSLSRVDIVRAPDVESQHGLSIKKGEQDALVIYHIDPQSPAADTALREGCEILAVNDHRVRTPVRCLEMLDHYMKSSGKCEILVSLGVRPRGCIYVMAKRVKDKSVLSGEGSTIDGLELEDKRGLVRVGSVPNSGFANGLRINKGDAVLAIDGKGIRCIDDARSALKNASGGCIPILTYNSFRKLKTAVMVDMSRELVKGDEHIGSKGITVNIEDNYNIHEKLGEGAFAVVKKATDKKTGKPYALKIVERSNLDKESEEALQEEIFILHGLNHDNIMNLHDVVVTINNYFLVTEFLEGGELFDRIVEKTSYTESEARDACKVIFDALNYCHSKRISHRDLKPENLLLQYKHSDSEIKIADFGFAKKAPTEDSLDTICGTPGYVAPEILLRKKYGTKCDMWSMGVIVFILIGGYPPFYADTEKELFRMTIRGKFQFDKEHWGDISDGAKKLISSLIVTDPSKRASAEDALKHPWIMEDKFKLKRSNLNKSQAELKRYKARMRFKKVIHSVMFLNFAGENAIFSGKKKRASIVLPQDGGVECVWE